MPAVAIVVAILASAASANVQAQDMAVITSAVPPEQGEAGRYQDGTLPTPPVTLDYASAQRRLLNTSDAIEAAEANVRSKSFQEGATRTLRRPDVDFEGQLLDYQKTLYLPLGSLAPIAAPFGIPDTLKSRTRRSLPRPIVSTTLPIYSGGQIGAVQEGARAQVAQARAERDIASDDAVLQMVRAYYGQQLAEHALGVRRDVMVGLDRHLADAMKLEAEGLATRAQRLQAQVARDAATREYEQAIAMLANANAGLAGILQAPAGVRPTSALFVNLRPLAPLATFTTAAMEAHPQIARLNAMEDQAKAGVNVQKARLRPTIYGFGQYNADRRDALFTDPDWSFGVGLRYKLISGTGRRQAVAAARETADQAAAGVREARTQLRTGVTRAWNDAEAARRRFQLLRSSLASTDENLRLQILSFREQQSTSLDVIDAQLAAGNARVQRDQAAYDYIVALAQLLNTSGQMSSMPDFVARADTVIP